MYVITLGSSAPIACLSYWLRHVPWYVGVTVGVGVTVRVGVTN